MKRFLFFTGENVIIDDRLKIQKYTGISHSNFEETRFQNVFPTVNIFNYVFKYAMERFESHR